MFLCFILHGTSIAVKMMSSGNSKDSQDVQKSPAVGTPTNKAASTKVAALDELRRLNANVSDFHSVSSLTANQYYQCHAFSFDETKYGKKVKVLVDMGGENWSIFLPERFSVMSEGTMELLNSLAQKQQYPQLCYKGKKGQAYDIDLTWDTANTQGGDIMETM